MAGAAVGALAMTGVGVAAGLTGHREHATAKVAVTLKEWSLTPTRQTVAAGPVTFTVANRGKLQHEFLVIRTTKAPNALPIQDGAATEAGLVKEISEFKPGLTKKLTVTLKSGKYVLICNIKGHYKAGQYSRFSVR